MVVMSTGIASGGATSKHPPPNTRLVAAGLLLISALGKVGASETLSVGGRHACVITTTGGVKVRIFTINTNVSYKYYLLCWLSHQLRRKK